MTDCPSQGRLEDLLTEHFGGDERDSLEEHVGNCADCQARLERLAANATDWLYWEEQLGTQHLSWPGTTGPVDETLAENWPVIEGYRIHGVLGWGGMGIVYKAEHKELDRWVALKKLRSGGANDPELQHRLRREATSLAQLQHPNVVQVYEILEHEGTTILSLELVAGGNLAQRLREETLSGEQAARMVEVLALTMQRAHDVGIVHRDLKPANVLLTPEGIPKIGDFGLARRWEAAGTTQTGRIMGTPSYVPPEQARALDGWSTPAVDVYALGAILYVCLTGRPPFRAESSVETLLQVVNDDPVPPSRLQPKTPRDLETICLKCLRKDPARRYESAAALRDDLRRFLDHEPIRARPVTQLERFRKWRRRHPVTSGLLLLLFAVIASSVSVITWKWREAVVQRRVSLEQTRLAEAAQREAVDRRRETEEFHKQSLEDLYFGRIALAEREIASENVSHAEQLLEQCPPTMRNWEWHYIHRRARQVAEVERRLKGHKRGQWEIAFSRDGSRISTSCIDGRVRIWNASTCKLITTFEGHVPNSVLRALLSAKGDLPLPAFSAQFSSDGKRIASGAWHFSAGKLTGIIKIWEVDTGKVVHDLLGHQGMVMRVAWSPKGRYLASCSTDKTVRLWDPATGKLIRTLTGHEDWVRGLKFSPDGTLLASAGVDATARIWDPHTGEKLHVLKGHVSSVTELDFSPDGKRLITCGLDGSVRQWNPITGEAIGEPLYGHTGQVLSVTFHPNGERFATSGMDKTINVWDARPGKERVILTLREHQDPTWSIAFDPTGRRLASAGFDQFDAWVWDGSPAAETELHDGWIRSAHKALVMDVAFSPDGEQLATGGGDGSVTTWRAANGERLQSYHFHRGAVWNVAFSPDGKRLASASRDTTVCIVDRANGRLLHRLKHARFVQGMAYSRDGKILAAGSADGDVMLWDATTGKRLRRVQSPHLYFVTALHFGPDDRVLVSAAADHDIKLHDVATGNLLASFQHKESSEVLTVQFSPDGTRLASATVVMGKGGQIALWDVSRIGDGEKPEQLFTLHAENEKYAHRDRVTRVSFSPDGRYLASSSTDRTVRIWDVTERKLVDEQRRMGMCWASAFSPEGDKIAASVNHVRDGKIWLWEFSPGR